jgi:hypothetical protein
LARVKGTAVQSSLRYVRERFGEALETRPGRCLADLRGFEGGAPQFCERIFGWMQRTLELAGAKNLRPRHDVCVHRGGAVCRFEGDWDA